MKPPPDSILARESEPAHLAILAACRPVLARTIACRATQKQAVITPAECAAIASFVDGGLHYWLRTGCFGVEVLEEWIVALAVPADDEAGFWERLQSCTLPIMDPIDEVIASQIDSLVAPRVYGTVMNGIGQEMAPARLMTEAHAMLAACYRQCIAREPRLGDGKWLLIRWPDLAFCEGVGRDHCGSGVALTPAAVAALLLPYVVVV